PIENSQSTISTSQTSEKPSASNQPDFQLERNEDSKIYIFKNNLFTRTLCPIKPGEPRQMTLQCTTCNWKTTTKVDRFQASNYSRHYELKHLNIAFNTKSEATRKKKSEVVSTTPANFFNPDTRKRPRTNTLPTPEFEEDEAYLRILAFLTENNVSFNAIGSPSFKAMIEYFNRGPFAISRAKATTLLSSTFDRFQAIINSQISEHKKQLGTFCLTFDLWTSKANDSYLGMILSYIKPDFELVYKLLTFEELINNHTGLYIYEEFQRSLEAYPGIDGSSIFSITRDNASNNDTFLTAFQGQNPDFQHDIRCIAHIFNLVAVDIFKAFISNSEIDDAINQYVNWVCYEGEENWPGLNLRPDFEASDQWFETAITRLRRMIVMTKHVTEVRKYFLQGIEHCKREKTLPKDFKKRVIPMDVSTRWNSTWNIIKAALEFRNVLEYVKKYSENEEFKAIFLTHGEWGTLVELEKYFKSSRLFGRITGLKRPVRTKCVQEAYYLLYPPAIQDAEHEGAQDSDDEYFNRRVPESEISAYLQEPVGEKKASPGYCKAINIA
ncbi:ribonuclease H-like domain-containing protein, partial [Cercophora samala]